MGAGASIVDVPREEHKEILEQIKHMYENDYVPKVTSFDTSAPEEYAAFKSRIKDYLESKGLPEDSKNKLFKQAEAYHKGPYSIGDIVRARSGMMMCEAVVVSVGDGTVDVDFGDNMETVAFENCALVLNGLELEIGDEVEYRPPGMALYFRGKVINFNEEDTTWDIQMDGEDPDDIERHVQFDLIRKVRTGRELSAKFKRGVMKIQALNRFTHVLGVKKENSESHGDV